MRIIRLDENSKQNILSDLLKRDPNNYSQYAHTVEAIVEDVKENKDKALFAYTEKFDGALITGDTVRVAKEEIQEAMEQMDPALLEVMKRSMKNIREIGRAHV